MSEKLVVTQAWMTWIDFGHADDSVIYDPVNGIIDQEPDLTWWEPDGEVRVLVIRGDRRPDIWLNDDGEVDMWSQPGSGVSLDTQAYEVDEMNILGFDSREDVLTTWRRACAFTEALNAMERTS